MQSSLSIEKIELPSRRGVVLVGLQMLCFGLPIIWAVAAGIGHTATRVDDTASGGAATEMHLPADQSPEPWIHDQAIIARDEGDATQTRQGITKVARTIKLDNLVPPIHFGLGESQIPDSYLVLLRDVLERMRDRVNVRLHFIGHADNLPLSHALAAQYGDNLGLSRERAGTTAEYCQRALGLPPEAISYEGRGDAQPIADNATEDGRQLNRRVEVQVWYDEIEEKPTEEEVIVSGPVNRIKVCRTETVCKLRYLEGHAHRVRVKNMIVPLHYDPTQLEVPGQFVDQIHQALVHLSDKRQVAAKFIAYTDDSPLSERNKRIYGNHLGLSRAVARRIALAIQEELNLPNAAVDSEGRGSSRPVATNATEQGRALNRRVEVEFWYDDPLQDLPDEPQICPDTVGMESVTRVYQAAEEIPPILLENGQPVVPDGLIDQLHRIMAEIGDKENVRLRFIGYTGNRRLDRRTAAVYGDDIGLSMARARRAMEAVSGQMGLNQEQSEFDGRGYVQSDDVVNAGFLESDISKVQVQVVYDEPAILDDYEGVEITPITREVQSVDPFSLNLMRITVDGQPLDDPGKCSSDVQRCTDVALEKADIQFKYDSLKLSRRLNVTAWPRTIRYQDLAETDDAENLVHFRLYTNYRCFIKRAEIRIFEEEQSTRDLPLAIIEMDGDGRAQWQAEFAAFEAPLRRLKYLVRVYDSQGLFDETTTQPLWVADHIQTPPDETNVDRELLAGYGESRIALQNIPLRGGTVQAHGRAIPQGHEVWMAGFAVPVDEQGRFVAEEILPAGIHTVEVAVLNPQGNGELFLRDLSLKESDWFTVGIADLTISGNQTNGPARLMAPDNPRYSDDVSVQGRVAFYTTGKFDNGWSLTASADTREGPVDEIFSNFLDKSPEALLRRMDPDYHYPTYGDDGTVVEDAPTSGKFYVRLKKEETYGLWGNFKIAHTENALAHVDRGLYGANLHYQPSPATGFGEPRLLIDGFAADPGTVAGRDEFRGTEGSLYYLGRQDVLEGSERVRIEVRDKDSGIVLAVKNLVPVIDYDIDYLQGRVLLARPLPATADDGLLVDSGSASGNPAYLVVRYEFTTGFDELDTMAVGGRAQYWFNDHVRIGLTADRDEEEDIDNNVGGADLTLRYSAATWLKLEGGYTTGPGVRTTASNDGGYIFSDASGFADTEDEAGAYRVEGSIGFGDVWDKASGRMSYYYQSLAQGYAAPGLVTARDVAQYGSAVELPLGDRFGVRLKADKQVQEEGLSTESGELDLNYRLGQHWTVSSGARHENREDDSPVVPVTQEEGRRTDASLRLLYDSHARWTTYGFAQTTVSKTGNREDNGRVGIGGSLRLSERFNLLGEISDGDLGTGGRLGTEYLYSDRSTLYLNYTMENERSDNGLRARKGTMTTGWRKRYSDGASVYIEEKYAHGDVPTGLVHSTGVELTPFDRLNLSAHLDFGTLTDPQSSAELERQAVGLAAGYGWDRLKLASGVEYRVDNSEHADGSFSERTSWLFKNSFKFQLSPDWRVLGKFNHALSESSLGDTFSGDYTEAVLGYAYRPVHWDRLNALFKYTYFYNRPANDYADQISAEVIQRSHIGAVDVMYDLTSRWALGGKYAYRHGQVALDRENPEFFDSRAHLSILRADWHFLHRWDALLELRRLDLPDARDSRDGVLIGLYRHLGEHIKLGAGYNFSDFSDDLTRLDYEHQGLFINLIGKI